MLCISCSTSSSTSSIPNMVEKPPYKVTPPCRIQKVDGGWYDTKFKVKCEVSKLNNKTVCLPIGMWEEVGSAWAEPTCTIIFDWAKNNNNPCLNGQSNFVLSSFGRAGLPQNCGDFTGFIYQINPTDKNIQYDKENGCQPFKISADQNFEIDLHVSRYSNYVPYPPIILKEHDFVNPTEEVDCTR